MRRWTALYSGLRAAMAATTRSAMLCIIGENSRLRVTSVTTRRLLRATIKYTEHLLSCCWHECQLDLLASALSIVHEQAQHMHCKRWCHGCPPEGAQHEEGARQLQGDVADVQPVVLAQQLAGMADDRRARLLDQLWHVQVLQVDPLPQCRSATVSWQRKAGLLADRGWCATCAAESAPALASALWSSTRTSGFQGVWPRLGCRMMLHC